MQRVPSPVRVLALVCLIGLGVPPAVASAQTTALFFDSQPGDYIGQGQQRTWTSADLSFSATSYTRDHVGIQATGEGSYSSWWRLDFASAAGTPLAVGVYENATRYPFQSPTSNGLNVSGSGRGCNTVFGRFVVHEIEIDAGGRVVRFAADFEQHCGETAAALFGAVRYNSTYATLNPFGGNYPLYGLRIEPAANGYVTAVGIDCGPGRNDCDEMYEPNTSVAVHAVPDPGYVFLGWASLDCVGAESVAVVITRLKTCIPVFHVAPGESGTGVPESSGNVLVLDGYMPVDGTAPTSAHHKIVYQAPLSTVSVAYANAGEISLWIRGPHGSTRHITFAAPRGEVLATGTYGPTAVSTYARGNEPLLDPGSNCSSGGRFVIHELAFSAGVLTRFTADFEAPCGSPASPLAGSVRYRGTRTTLLPFDGAFPRYQLQIRSSMGGYVSGAGVDCGDGGRTDCEETFSTATLVQLQAIATAGYEFLGWTGACTGQSTITTIRVDRNQRCIAAFHPTPTSGSAADASYALGTLYLDAPGSTETATRRLFLAPDAFATSYTNQQASFSFRTLSSEASVSFAVPNGRILPGEYDEAYGYQSAAFPSLSVSGCFSSMGSFTVYEAEYDGNGAVIAFAADFEAHCSNSTQPYVAGAVRFHSSRATIRPFNGRYPRYRLAIVRNAHGRVTAPGIDCGPSTTDCSEQYDAAGVIPLQAIPEPGYRFLAWTGACQGGAFTSATVDRTRRCAAMFTALRPGSSPQDARLAGRSLLTHSHPGDPVGRGQRVLLLDTSVSVFAFSGRTSLSVSVNHPDGRSWQLHFQPPSGQQLAVGVYAGAVGRSGSTSPAIDVRSYQPTGYCSSTNAVSGRFVIHEITFASATSPTITALALDFEQRCTADSPPLLGSLRYNSTRNEIRPFAPAGATSVPFDLTADGAADLLWQNRDDGRLLVWHMNGVSHIFNEPLAPPQVADPNWHIVGSADGNGDGHPDLYWQHQTTGALAIWTMRETGLVSGDALNPGAVADTNWKVRTVADMDADGHPDLVWQHIATGHVAVWFMNGRQLRSGEPLGNSPVPDVNWKIVGAGDANRDGSMDLFWHHTGTGHLAVWFMRGATMLAGELLAPARVADTNWRVRGVADLDRNGSADLLWQNVATLQTAVWLLNGLRLIDGRLIAGPEMPGAWHIVTPR